MHSGFNYEFQSNQLEAQRNIVRTVVVQICIIERNIDATSKQKLSWCCLDTKLHVFTFSDRRQQYFYYTTDTYGNKDPIIEMPMIRDFRPPQYFSPASLVYSRFVFFSLVFLNIKMKTNISLACSLYQSAAATVCV